MIIQITRLYPYLMKAFYVAMLVVGIHAIEDNDDWMIKVLKLLPVLFFIIFSDPYKGIKIESDNETLHYGIGVRSFFKANRTFTKSAIKSLEINQREDFYYSIDLVLHHGEKIALDKIATLDKAHEKRTEIEQKIIKYWS